ncbi:MAG: leukotriene A4 hydrolase C-terminal domain-containing protein, partial [Thermoanaerobaculia bacterium]|nr:leukotriene A4 hydrolase C-terminal domain-containing protein [Thermoanaerobaculia bacterium]
ERYDLAIMPPSYHIGGMEHARLNFVNPSFISGDGSLVSLIAHELGHSWSGNLVTTANWDGVWLNEGLTVWLERRIMEELFGRDYEEMLAANGATNLHAHVDAVTASGGSTSLHQDFGGRDPNEGFSTLAYEKGYSFMRTLEERVGRAEFDLFIKAFFSRHQFRWIDAAGFLASLRAGPLAGKPGLETELRLEEWIFESGIPANAGDVSSTRFAAVDRELAAFHSGAAPSSLRTSGWSPHEFAYFLRNARDSIIATRMGTLESTFGFDATRNLSLLFRWSLRSAMHRYAPSFDAMERYLMSVGSGSGLYAIYATLLNTGERPRALDIYSRARPRYHPYSQWSIDALFNPPARLSGAPRALPPTKY